jgi:hypothetical protein
LQISLEVAVDGSLHRALFLILAGITSIASVFSTKDRRKMTSCVRFAIPDSKDSPSDAIGTQQTFQVSYQAKLV